MSQSIPQFFPPPLASSQAAAAYDSAAISPPRFCFDEDLKLYLMYLQCSFCPRLCSHRRCADVAASTAVFCCLLCFALCCCFLSFLPVPFLCRFMFLLHFSLELMRMSLRFYSAHFLPDTNACLLYCFSPLHDAPCSPVNASFPCQ